MKREKLLISVRDRSALTRILKMISHLTVLYSVILYGILLYKTFSIGLFVGIKTLAVSAAAFLVVSAVRIFIDAPRPYEIYDVFPVPPKNKKGKSFPGRHAFSVFCVSTLAFPLFPIMSLVGAALGVLLSISRVLLGIHFVKDVVCGSVIGIIAGVVGILTASIPF